ncbi:M1 family metallopeptidase [Autumnicola edwardsiae]|uniref:M1 family metallopeptidase n=1 Tax=Autumnicola edwardsiae TaxID=3075594 RepID=A0ABU3CR66_9FLAO|nr:M1 family metallopeptidase [Zunongwangia sp. F297]MDT0648840.1 M1 family metallopeptidase [Zunongwangia sp. F297]
MKLFSRSFLVLTFFSFSLSAVNAQEVIENNQSDFGEFMDRSGNRYRAASGHPGPEYWQNETDYTIEATLNDEDHSISGKITLTYTNNSPQDLEFIWMHLEQNRFTEDSRGTLTTPIGGNRYVGDTDGGYEISNLQAKVKRSTSSKYLINDTRMQVFFNRPIPANGGEATVSMNFSYKIPVEGMDRMGRLDVEDGTIYAMAQWFPRAAVFDDIDGWNVEPYLGAGEFYLDYGDYDFKITAPYDHIVVASGELQNPREVLSSTMRERMEMASKSDSTVFIVKPEEVNDMSIRAKQDGMLTWHFKMENTRDVAFASSSAFIWDAARINLPDGKKAMAQSAYPKESAGQGAWGRSTEYSKYSVEHYAEKWFNYPYPVAVNVAADIGGMEYPGLNFCGWQAEGESLWGVTDHEFGHNWFPMIVGTNERRYAWMDEGFNTFINHYSSLEFNDGEYGSNLNQTRRLVSWFNRPTREGIDTYPDVTNLRNLGMTAYYKPAIGLLLLREYILGHERFDNAFKSYIETWAYKHPQPKDFFNHMENVAGENLSWFWKGWFYGTGNIDISLDGVQRRQGNYVITVSNKGDIPMPVELKLTYEDGTTENLRLPVEIWQRGDTWSHLLETEKTLESVELDPEKILPDVNFSNDSWPTDFYND